MKTGLFSGWKARFYAVCMLMLVSAMAMGVPGTALAQAEVTPAPTPDVVTEQLTPPAP
ncbi:ammonia channel protein, partial [Xanthomonas campestris pv. phormiicola]|nr:ammonia channel protein [Xanthomonas campestris pv. phormiicola]